MRTSLLEARAATLEGSMSRSLSSRIQSGLLFEYLEENVRIPTVKGWCKSYPVFVHTCVVCESYEVHTTVGIRFLSESSNRSPDRNRHLKDRVSKIQNVLGFTFIFIYLDCLFGVWK
jgi:hypothetical protein